MSRPTDDAVFLADLDLRLGAGVRRARGRLACRVGCTECCIGPSPITALDARRLAQSLHELVEAGPSRAVAVI